ncbi:MAG: endonuclease domain-containing protein [Sandarakinorhabdus sp.]|nr:endonuclease domain-containing protein [Sandarakinorhabdus sp.]
MKLSGNAKAMRRSLTPAEAVLWSILRTPPIDDWHFRRQVVFRPLFIADFASHSARLIIEADGQSHDLSWDADINRTAWLGERGYAVIRFGNAQILGDAQSVWREICARLPATGPPPRSRQDASRPPLKGEG